eukprot:m.253639 g.253639  ORF g.253639 m.253639 type:complete len:743 (+) comp16161_c0_seq2:219-2447(+)
MAKMVFQIEQLNMKLEEKDKTIEKMKLDQVSLLADKDTEIMLLKEKNLAVQKELQVTQTSLESSSAECRGLLERVAQMEEELRNIELAQDKAKAKNGVLLERVQLAETVIDTREAAQQGEEMSTRELLHEKERELGIERAQHVAVQKQNEILNEMLEESTNRQNSLEIELDIYRLQAQARDGDRTNNENSDVEDNAANNESGHTPTTLPVDTPNPNRLRNSVRAKRAIDFRDGPDTDTEMEEMKKNSGDKTPWTFERRLIKERHELKTKSEQLTETVKKQKASIADLEYRTESYRLILAELRGQCEALTKENAVLAAKRAKRRGYEMRGRAKARLLLSKRRGKDPEYYDAKPRVMGVAPDFRTFFFGPKASQSVKARYHSHSDGNGTADTASDVSNDEEEELEFSCSTQKVNEISAGGTSHDEIDCGEGVISKNPGRKVRKISKVIKKDKRPARTRRERRTSAVSQSKSPPPVVSPIGWGGNTNVLDVPPKKVQVERPKPNLSNTKSQEKIAKEKPNKEAKSEKHGSRRSPPAWKIAFETELKANKKLRQKQNELKAKKEAEIQSEKKASKKESKGAKNPLAEDPTSPPRLSAKMEAAPADVNPLSNPLTVPPTVSIKRNTTTVKEVLGRGTRSPTRSPTHPKNPTPSTKDSTKPSEKRYLDAPEAKQTKIKSPKPKNLERTFVIKQTQKQRLQKRNEEDLLMRPKNDGSVGTSQDLMNNMLATRGGMSEEEAGTITNDMGF